MKGLRKLLDSQEKHFIGSGKLKLFYPLFEMLDTFLYTPSSTTQGAVSVRDGLDLKRAMITVGVALIPCILMANWNTGFQSLSAVQSLGLDRVPGWRGDLFHALGLTVDPNSLFASIVLGALYFIPVFLVTNIVGGLVEVVFAVVRKHEINEGFLVTGLLFPLTMPPTVPLWQVAVGIIFGVFFAKEIFGGTGKNFLNVALTGRAFLYFAYPAQHSGDLVWTAADGFSGATILGQAALGGMDAVTFSWWNSFLGVIPGSMGETSALAALIGAVILIATGIGSWRVMLSMILATLATAFLLNQFADGAAPMWSMPPAWHLVVGGFAFGCVFMATDPVTAPVTDTGRWLYGALIGFMTVVVRAINPAFPEGVMLAILFANVFAPLMDWFVIAANVKRRRARYAQG